MSLGGSVDHLDVNKGRAWNQMGSGGVEYVRQGLLLRKSDEGVIGSFLISCSYTRSQECIINHTMGKQQPAFTLVIVQYQLES